MGVLSDFWYTMFGAYSSVDAKATVDGTSLGTAAASDVSDAASSAVNAVLPTNWEAWGIGIGAIVVLLLIVLLLHELESF